jgi:hypothetical protein
MLDTANARAQPVAAASVSPTRLIRLKNRAARIVWQVPGRGRGVARRDRSRIALSQAVQATVGAARLQARQDFTIVS